MNVLRDNQGFLKLVSNSYLQVDSKFVSDTTESANLYSGLTQTVPRTFHNLTPICHNLTEPVTDQPKPDTT